jgi:hypothetical protein
MERHYNNDFERFLKQNADQYRLYPSTKPWKGIYSHFHGKHRWFGLGAILLLLTGSLITVLVINSPKQNPVAQAKTSANSSEQKAFAPASSLIGSIEASKNNNSTLISDYRISSLPLTSLSFNESFLATNNQNDPTTNFSPIINTPIINNYIGMTASDKLLTSPQPELLAPMFISLTDELTDQSSYIQALEQKRSLTSPQQKNFVSNSFDWTIESVLNSYKKKNSIGLQFNFTPTISYRKLSENKAYTQSAQNSSLYNINDAVTQKPAIGLEVGLTAKYSISSRVKIKTGLQFNVNRYDIKAYDYPIEPATIALAYGSRVDSLHTISTYRNFNGNTPSWLQNLYFQIAMPIGVEVKIVGDDKVQFGVAGTFQPLYVLSDKAYLLTTDYKNYTEGSQAPGLIRRWNVNTALETYVSYSTGKLKWQVGPQMRYQILSSFVKKYPIKEHLFDFGLKVGISLNTP